MTRPKLSPGRSARRWTRGSGVELSLCLLVVGPALYLACGGEPPKPPVTPAPTLSASAAASAPAPKSVPAATADVSAAAKASYQRGHASFRAGDLLKAKQAFLDAISADPRAGAAHVALGTVMEHLGDVSGAQQEFKAALAVKPDDTTAIGAYAMSLANAGRRSEADSFLTGLQRKNQDSAPIMTLLADVKSMGGDSATAQQLAQDALRLAPDYRPAMVVIAHDHYRAHRLELAKYALQAILDGFDESSAPRDKDNPDAHLLRGLIEEEAGQRAAAMKDFDAARTVRPDLVEALLHLGVMKLQAGNVQEATPLLESAVKFAPNSAVANLNLGDAYRLGGRVADAKGQFERALAMDSSLAGAHYDTGLLYLFSPSVPGATQSSQVDMAIRELETYRSMRGAKLGGDDIDELLSRAQAKQADLKVAASTPTASAASSSSASVPPATSGASSGSAPPKTAASGVSSGTAPPKPAASAASSAAAAPPTASVPRPAASTASSARPAFAPAAAPSASSARTR